MSYDMIDRFLRNNLGDDDYAEYSEALDSLCAPPAQPLPFGVGGGLVAIKTLLSRDPCGHANTAIQMIDAILAEQPAQQQEPVAYIEHHKGGDNLVWDDPGGKRSPLYTSPQPAQQEPVAWMHEWEDGEKIPMIQGRDDRNQDAPKTARPLVYGDTPPQSAQQDIPDLIAREFGVSRGTAYDMMREALAEQPAPVQQEPFGYLYEGTAEHTRHKTLFEKTRAERFETRWWREIGPCYTSPPAQRTWVGLTDEERQACINYRAVEAKLKEKNT